MRGERVVAEGSPTLRRRKLAAELRRLREDAELNGVQVAKALRWSTSKISRMENGQVAPSAKDVEKLLKYYGVEREKAEALSELARPEGSKGWWDAYSDVLDETVLERIGLEAGADRIQTWHAMLIPGLLQTREYATQIAGNYQRMEFTPPQTITRRTEARMRRQRRLTGATPLTFDAVLDEPALKRRFGDNAAELMNHQLRQLIKVSELPNVTIRVLLLSQAHPIDFDNFVIMSFPSTSVLGPLSDDMVYTENHPHYTLRDDPDTAYKYSLVFDLLTEVALDPDASREYIASLAGM